MNCWGGNAPSPPITMTRIEGSALAHYPITRGVLRAALGAPFESFPTEEIAGALEHARALAVFPLARRCFLDAGRTLPKLADAYWREHLGRVVLLRALRGDIRRAFADRVDWVFLKGEPMAQRLFSDPLARSSVDIDLLVRPRDIEAAHALLARCGFHSASGARALRPWCTNQTVLRHERWPVVVELHWALTIPAFPSLCVDALMERRARFEDGTPVFDDDALFFVLLHHFHQHQGALKTSLDLAAWFDVVGARADWAWLDEGLEDVGGRGVLEWFNGTASRMRQRPAVHTRLALSALSTLSARWGHEALSEGSFWLRMIKTGEKPTPLRSVLLQLVSVAALDRPSARLHAVLRLLFLGPHRLGTRTARLLSLSETEVRAPARRS